VDGELHLLLDVLVGEVHVAEVLLKVKGRLAVFLRRDRALIPHDAADDALSTQGVKGQPSELANI